MGWGRGSRRGQGGNGKQKYSKKVEDEQTTTSNADDENVDGNGDKRGNTKCNRCGEVDHKTVSCPGQVCGVSGRDHLAEICANIGTALVCEEDAKASDDKIFVAKRRDLHL